MHNHSIANNETFFGDKKSVISDGSILLGNNLTKISDVSKEFRELNKDIDQTIHNPADGVSGSGLLNNQINNATNGSIGILFDEVWNGGNRRSPDTSENFELKLREIKKKAKTPVHKQVHHVITRINNPRKNSQFKIMNNGEKQENNPPNRNIEDDDSLATDEGQIPNSMHLNSVKINNLSELNFKSVNTFSNCDLNANANANDRYNYLRQNVNVNGSQNYPRRDIYDGNMTMALNEEYLGKNYNDVGNKINCKTFQQVKFMEKNNVSTGISTSESNESFDSLKNTGYNKFGQEMDRKYLGSNTPVNLRNYPNTPMTQYNNLGGKKINFNSPYPIANNSNNYQNNNNNNPYCNNFLMDKSKAASVCIPCAPTYQLNITNNFNNGLFSPNYDNNVVNLPENAFSFNYNAGGDKSHSDKKKSKKSREEVDQTLFNINIDNIIYGRDKRTTVMIRHIPNKYSTVSLLEELNSHFKGKYDFFYLPMDPDNQCNLGYAFVNFLDPMHILNFYEAFKARKWKKYKSHKVLNFYLF